MDTDFSKLYSAPMTYLIASNMRPITCSPGAWLHWHQCMIDWEGNGTSQSGQRRKASPVNLRSTGEAFRRWLGWTSASVDWEVNLRIPLSGVSSPRPENRVGGGIAPPASHTTGHAGPRPAI